MSTSRGHLLSALPSACLLFALSAAPVLSQSPTHLLVPDTTAGRILSFDPASGDLLDPNFIPATLELQVPLEISLSTDGRTLQVSDNQGDIVHAFTPDGVRMGTFAPRTGREPGVLDGPYGIHLEGNGELLVCSSLGPNAQTVLRFDAEGNFTRRFLEPPPGISMLPLDVLRRRNGTYLVSNAGQGQLLEYDAEGRFTRIFALVDTVPAQIAESGDGNVLLAIDSGVQQGILEFSSDGSQLIGSYQPLGLGRPRGVHELPNGHLLVSSHTGVHEIDRAGNLVDTKIQGFVAGFVNPVNLPRLGQPLFIAKGSLELDFKKRAHRNLEPVDSLAFQGTLNPAALHLASLDLTRPLELRATVGLGTSRAFLGTPVKANSRRVSWIVRDAGGGTTRLSLDLRTGAFRLIGRKIDLTDLSDPLNAAGSRPLELDLFLGLGGLETSRRIRALYAQRAPDERGRFTYRWPRATSTHDQGTFTVSELSIEQRTENGSSRQRASLVASLRAPGGNLLDPRAALMPTRVAIGAWSVSFEPSSFQERGTRLEAEDLAGTMWRQDVRRHELTIVTPWLAGAAFGPELAPVTDPTEEQRQKVLAQVTLANDRIDVAYLTWLGREGTCFRTGSRALLR